MNRATPRERLESGGRDGQRMCGCDGDYEGSQGTAERKAPSLWGIAQGLQQGPRGKREAGGGGVVLVVWE